MAAVFTCPPGSICSPQAKTPVGPNKTGIFHASATKVTTQGSNGEVTAAETVVYIIKNDTFQPAAISKDGGKTYAFSDPNYPLMTGVAGADLQNDLKNPQGAIRKNVDAGVSQSVDKAGLKAVDKKTIVASTANNAPDSGTDGGPAGPTDTGDAIKTTKTSGFGDFVYPTGLGKTKQDVIKFTMLEYNPSGLGPVGQQRGGFGNARNEATDRKSAGTVVLPIPNGISDTNSCDWGADSMNALEAALAAAAFTGITDGLGAGVESFGKSLSAAIGEDKTGRGIGAAFAGAAMGGDRAAILSRADGAVINPNLELLFTGPQLRPFQFTFKLSARDKNESKQIIKILNFFKRGMSPIKTESNLFLKAPNTFKIQYLHLGQSGKDHPYIGRIKECALQSVTTRYTPEGQYATFSDGVMVSYQLTMQFQELEPVFNSDYADIEGIGF